jgi:hypothetical protein
MCRTWLLQGMVSEFQQQHGEQHAATPSSSAAHTSPSPSLLSSQQLLVNGLWQLLLALGLLLTSLWVVQARRWRFLRGWARGFLADYGVPLLVVAWSGLSFALAGSGAVVRRVQTPNTWEVSSGLCSGWSSGTQLLGSAQSSQT